MSFHMENMECFHIGSWRLRIYEKVRNFYARRMFKGMYFEFETLLPWNCLLSISSGKFFNIVGKVSMTLVPRHYKMNDFIIV